MSMMVDLPTVKEEFASIIQKITVQPWTMLEFIVWLDVKLAEYKINGYMVLDQSSGSIPDWLMNLNQLYTSQKSPDGPISNSTLEPQAEIIDDDDGNSSDDVKILPTPSGLRNPAERLPSIQNIAHTGMRKESMGRRFGDRTSQRQSAESMSDSIPKRTLPSDARFNPAMSNVYSESKRRKVLRTPPFSTTPGKSPTSVGQISRPDLSRVSFMDDNNIQQSESYSEDNSNFSSYPSRQGVANKERKTSSTITRPQPGSTSMSNSPMFNYGEADRLIARQYSDDSNAQADDTLSQESQYSTQETLPPKSITSPNSKGRQAEPVPTQLFRNNVEINKSQTDQASAVSSYDPTFPGDSRDDSSSFTDLPGDMQIKTEAPDDTDSQSPGVDSIHETYLNISRKILCPSEPSGVENGPQSLSFANSLDHTNRILKTSTRIFKKDLTKQMDRRKCPHCPEIFAEKKQRKQHIDIYHQNPLHNCDLCGKRFKMVAALNMHKQQMHKEQLHSDWLPNDEDEFQPISNGDTMIIDGLSDMDFLSYIPTFAVAKPTFACEICGTGFSSKRAMYEHNKGKHEKRLFLCPCGMSFKWRPALNNHSKKCSVVAATMI